MGAAADRSLFYSELADWWPVISPPDDYAQEAAYAEGLLLRSDGDVREVLELGSGGGCNASHLSHRFDLTLVDLSDEMLAVSRRLNPGCVHLRGDMRTVRLGRTFDAVFVHDAIDYMTTHPDLRAAVSTAFAHCRPGAVAVFMPDQITETFTPDADEWSNADAAGRAVHVMSRVWDPDPSDTQFEVRYTFALCEPGGDVRTVDEVHTCGVFSRGLWMATLTDVGFSAVSETEITTEDRAPREVFIGRRP